MSYFDQTIDDKLVQADAYYGSDNSIVSVDWLRYTDDERKASLNQAQREIDLYLGTDLATTFDDQDFPLTDQPNLRPDYAVFEHALFILQNTVRSQSHTSGAREIESDIYQQEEKTTGVALSPQASRYLKLNRIQLDRG